MEFHRIHKILQMWYIFFEQIANIYLVIEFAIFCIWYLLLIRDENMSVTTLVQKVV